MNAVLNNYLEKRFLVLFFIPFILGIITVLGFSPYNLTFLNFLTFPILLFLIFVVKKKTQTKYRKKKNNTYFFILGLSFGFGFFVFGNYWITISLTHDAMFKSLIPFAFTIIPLFLSIFFGFAILASAHLASKNIYFILLFSLSFSIFEFLRGNLLTGFPWNLISYTWSWSLETMQVLSLIGTYSLSLISITFFCSPFLLFQNKVNKKNIFFVLFLVVLFICNYLYGSYKIKSDNHSFNKDFSIKIISPNFSLKSYKTKDEITQLERLIKISNPTKSQKTIFIWPEGIFYESYLHDLGKYKDLFIKNFSKNHLIVLGVTNLDKLEGRNNKYFNSLVVLNNKLEIKNIYDKINLVPFGEYLPFENFLSQFGFKKITKGYNSFSSGTDRKIINLGENFNDSLILPLICYEIIYPGGIKEKKQFPDLVINISEDAWFGETIGPHQHFTKAIYRSVEEGVFIARSANKGISAFINPNGFVVKSLNTGESGNIELDFPQFMEPTLFSIYGNKIFFFIILLYIFSFLVFKKMRI